MASPRSLCWTCHPDSGRAVRAVAAVATSTRSTASPRGGLLHGADSWAQQHQLHHVCLWDLCFLLGLVSIRVYFLRWDPTLATSPLSSSRPNSVYPLWWQRSVQAFGALPAWENEEDGGQLTQCQSLWAQPPTSTQGWKFLSMHFKRKTGRGRVGRARTKRTAQQRCAPLQESACWTCWRTELSEHCRSPSPDCMHWVKCSAPSLSCSASARAPKHQLWCGLGLYLWP